VRIPAIGDIVHYTSYGTPGGEYTSECRAAIITELTGDPDHPGQVALCVLNPTGQFFNRAVGYDNGGGRRGDPHCPDRPFHRRPQTSCECGWTENQYQGGTWHWPEQV
jgi:hypothetical protein